MERFRKDLEAAKIEFLNAKGEHADFHALRKTFATNLTLAGTPQRVTMELMRHCDMRLTAITYTDAGLLPIGEAVLSLPSISGSASQIDSQSTVAGGPPLSPPVTENGIQKSSGTRMNTGAGHDLTSLVNGSPKSENGTRSRLPACGDCRHPARIIAVFIQSSAHLGMRAGCPLAPRQHGCATLRQSAK